MLTTKSHTKTMLSALVHDDVTLITLDRVALEMVHSFKYLGTLITCTGDGANEIVFESHSSLSMKSQKYPSSHFPEFIRRLHPIIRM